MLYSRKLCKYRDFVSTYITQFGSNKRDTIVDFKRKKLQDANFSTGNVLSQFLTLYKSKFRYRVERLLSQTAVKNVTMSQKAGLSN